MDFAKELARNFPDLTRNLPSSDDIVRALGLHARRSSGSDLVPSVALFGAGMLVGAGLALLFAPTSGRELREELGERAADLRDRATSVAEDAASEARQRAS
jgi:hypothetical protein